MLDEYAAAYRILRLHVEDHDKYQVCWNYVVRNTGSLWADTSESTEIDLILYTGSTSLYLWNGKGITPQTTGILVEVPDLKKGMKLTDLYKSM